MDTETSPIPRHVIPETGIPGLEDTNSPYVTEYAFIKNLLAYFERTRGEAVRNQLSSVNWMFRTELKYAERLAFASSDAERSGLLFSRDFNREETNKHLYEEFVKVRDEYKALIESQIDSNEPVGSYVKSLGKAALGDQTALDVVTTGPIEITDVRAAFIVTEYEADH